MSYRRWIDVVLVLLVLQSPFGLAKDISLQQVGSCSYILKSRNVELEYEWYSRKLSQTVWLHTGRRATGYCTSASELRLSTFLSLKFSPATPEVVDEEVEEFYDQIRTALEILKSQDTVLVVGGFKAKVGANCFYPKVWDRHELEMQNDRGE